MPHTTAPEWVTFALVVVKTLVAAAGGVVTYFAFKAYRRSRARSMGLLAGGFALVTAGAVLGGTVYELFGVPLAVGVLVEGLFVLAGLALIARSLTVE